MTATAKETAAQRAPHLLLGLIDAAISLGESIGVSVDRTDQVVDRKEFEAAQAEMVGALSTICQQARSFETGIAGTVRTIGDAQRILAAAQQWYTEQSVDFLDKLAQWEQADVMKSRVRLRCVDAIAEQHRDEVGWSRTRADKEASAHPDYAEHKDLCSDLSIEKAEAEIEMKLAESAVKNARTVLASVITREQIDILRGPKS